MLNNSFLLIEKIALIYLIENEKYKGKIVKFFDTRKKYLFSFYPKLNLQNIIRKTFPSIVSARYDIIFKRLSHFIYNFSVFVK